MSEDIYRYISRHTTVLREDVRWPESSVWGCLNHQFGSTPLNWAVDPEIDDAQNSCLADQNLESAIDLESTIEFQSIPHMFVCIGDITENPVRYCTYINNKKSYAFL